MLSVSMFLRIFGFEVLSDGSTIRESETRERLCEKEREINSAELDIVK